MAKQPETVFDFDISKYLTDMKVPGVDWDSVVASQQKNIEALTAANKLAFEGMQAVMKRQAEIIRQSMEEAASAAQGVASAEDPQTKVALQTEVTKETFEKAISNMRELSEMMAKSNTEVFEMLNSRISAVLDEVKDVVAKTNAVAKK
ncbi:MAG: phasin family protein [Rhodospirillaceae bacterium]